MRTRLESVVAELPEGERRDGQVEMCEAVAAAIESGEHLIVEAGTGVGKSLAYLLPAVLSGRRVVIATARKTLQDQLIGKDIPFLAGVLAEGVDAAVLKGRSNYLCLAKLSDAAATGAQGELLDGGDQKAVLRKLAKWGEDASTGDLAELPFSLAPALRAVATVSARECPRNDCDWVDDCFAERALHLAREAPLVVTNIDLYCLDVVTGGALIGPHEVAIIDEAHELEAIASRTMGIEIGKGRFGWLAGQLKGLLVAGATEPARVEQAGERLVEALEEHSGRRLDPGEGSVAEALDAADAAVGEALATVRKVDPGLDKKGRVQRAVQASGSLLEDLRWARALAPGFVAWVPDGFEPSLQMAPIDVGPTLARRLFADRTVVLTSATLGAGGDLEPIARRLGLRPELFEAPAADDGGDSDGGTDRDGDSDDGDEAGGGTGDGRKPWAHRSLRVSSPFDYRANSLLYCARHLPDPRRNPAGFDDAALEELAGLVQAAGGRTLALFTSHRMLRLAAAGLRDRFPWKVLVQEGPPQGRLVEEFRDDEHSCLLATMGYWQGVDVAGTSLSLVVIDRLPFPRPDDPLLSARREAVAAAGGNPFAEIDLVVAGTLLAQGAGRLIRTTTDRGVVAVLDPRLARAGYRRSLLASMPPMKRTIDPGEVKKFLESIA